MRYSCHVTFRSLLSSHACGHHYHVDCWTDAIVEAKLAARKENAPLKKLQRLLRKEKGHGAGGSSSRLSKEEEELAKARDKQRIIEDDEATLY